MSRANLFSSAAFRLVAAYYGIFCLVTIGLTALLYFKVSDVFWNNLKNRVTATHLQLEELGRTEGIGALKGVVQSISAGPGDPDTIALFLDADGRVIAGDIEPIPQFDGWKVLRGADVKFVQQDREVDPFEIYYAIWRPVAGGYLLVAQIGEDVEDMQRAMLLALILSLGSTLILTLAGGIWLGRRAQQRIVAIDSALDAFARGKLDQRIPLSRGNDDLDRISGRINRTFDHIGALISSMRQISTDIAHDLKTPIGHLKHRLDTVRQTAKSTKDFRTALDDAAGDIDSIVETFEALLSIAQIEAGARKARFKQVDLVDVLTNVSDAYQHVAEDSGFSFAASLDPEKQSIIQGDYQLLTQLFANLLENAFRHCPPGTHVQMVLKSSTEGPMVKISDTGPGIPEDQHEKVFRRLYRLDKSRTTPGSGLGLSLVAAIVDLHDAKITLGDNAPGLSVTIEFPVAAET